MRNKRRSSYFSGVLSVQPLFWARGAWKAFAAFGLFLFLSFPLEAQEAPVRLVALGDSLIAGPGLAPGESFPVQLEKALRARGFQVEVADAGVSGDTTAAALARLDWAVAPETEGVIIVLGGNDALRGQPPRETRANLEAIVRRLKEKKVELLLAGMKAPRNLGSSYTEAFDSLYPEIAEAHGLLLYPFFLEGVVFEQDLNFMDGIHPNAKGMARIVSRILPIVEELVARIKARRKSGPGGG